MLFNLVLEKNVTFKDMVLASSVESGCWSWRRNFSVLKEKLMATWNWDINFDGIFSVKEAYDLISSFEEVGNSSLYKVT